MSEQENWLDRQRRMVKCKRHGLHFDPKMASGCYLCLKEAAKRRVYKQPKFLVLLISALGMALVLYKMFGPEPPPNPEDAPLQGLTIEEERESTRFDPAPYRPTVQTFEEALFRSKVESSADLALTGPRLASAANTLRAAVDRDHPGSALAASLRDLEQGIPSAGFSHRHLKDARKQWLRIRGRYLEEAPWFEDPPEKQAAGKVPVAEYQTLASDLITFLEDGAAEARAMGDSADAQRWKSFQSRWRERFKEMAVRSPARPPAEAAAELLLAYQSLDQAMRRADSLSRNPRFPGSDAPFEEALREARKAQDALRVVR